jgi:hypothetical protein
MHVAPGINQSWDHLELDEEKKRIGMFKESSRPLLNTLLPLILEKYHPVKYFRV